MSASLELDCPISVGGMGSRVFVGKPNVARQAHIDAGHNCVRGSVLPATTSAKREKGKVANWMTAGLIKMTSQNFSYEQKFKCQFRILLTFRSALLRSPVRALQFNGFYEWDSFWIIYSMLCLFCCFSAIQAQKRGRGKVSRVVFVREQFFCRDISVMTWRNFLIILLLKCSWNARKICFESERAFGRLMKMEWRWVQRLCLLLHSRPSLMVFPENLRLTHCQSNLKHSPGLLSIHKISSLWFWKVPLCPFLLFANPLSSYSRATFRRRVLNIWTAHGLLLLSRRADLEAKASLLRGNTRNGFSILFPPTERLASMRYEQFPRSRSGAIEKHSEIDFHSTDEAFLPLTLRLPIIVPIPASWLTFPAFLLSYTNNSAYSLSAPPT